MTVLIAILKQILSFHYLVSDWNQQRMVVDVQGDNRHDQYDTYRHFLLLPRAICAW